MNSACKYIDIDNNSYSGYSKPIKHLFTVTDIYTFFLNEQLKRINTKQNDK